MQAYLEAEMLSKVNLLQGEGDPQEKKPATDQRKVTKCSIAVGMGALVGGCDVDTIWASRPGPPSEL